MDTTCFCSVRNHIFCSAVFIPSTIVHILTDCNYSVYYISSNMKISIFWQFSRRFFYWLRTLQISDTFFGLWNTNKQNFNPISYWNGFFINLLYLMSGKHNFFCMRLGVLLWLSFNSCLKIYNETYLLDKLISPIDVRFSWIWHQINPD